jgi:predicted CoA-binding protein
LERFGSLKSFQALTVKKQIRIIAVFENSKQAQQCVDDAIENFGKEIFIGFGMVT